MASMSFTPDENLEEQIRTYHSALQYKDPNLPLSSVLAELVSQALEYRDVIKLIQSNDDLRLSLEAEAKRLNETHPPIYK